MCSFVVQIVFVITQETLILLLVLTLSFLQIRDLKSSSEESTKGIAGFLLQFLVYIFVALIEKEIPRGSEQGKHLGKCLKVEKPRASGSSGD